MKPKSALVGCGARRGFTLIELLVVIAYVYQDDMDMNPNLRAQLPTLKFKP